MRFNCFFRQIRLKQMRLVMVLLLGIIFVSEVHAAMIMESAIPRANAINIPANSNIIVEFDVLLNAETVSYDTFTVNGSVSGFNKGTFTVSGDKITFDPEKNFAAGEVVTLILTTGIKSADGSSLTAPLASQFVIATTSNGTGYFSDNGQLLEDIRSYSAALGDIDNDGDLDAFVAASTEANKIWKNKGSGIFEKAENIDEGATHAAFGDFDKDGDIDIFVVKLYGPSRIWLNDGNGNFTGGEGFGEFGYSKVSLGDLDGDGDLDAFVVDMTKNNTVWLNNGAGLFEEGQSLPGPGGLYAAIGDLNGDGYLDAFIANKGPNQVWFNNGKGVFTNSGQSMKRSESTSVALGDLDGDGDLDAFEVSAYGSEEGEAAPDRVWKNNGKGEFENTQSLDDDDVNKYSESYVSLCDLDGDGDLDAFVVNKEQPNKVWLNNGTGKFYKGQVFTEIGKSLGAALGDLDGDGDVDAFIANFNESKIWLNLYTGDIDGNGYLDLKDAIIGLRILSAGTEAKGIFLNDVNGDKKIGMEDVVFILQFVSHLR